MKSPKKDKSPESKKEKPKAASEVNKKNLIQNIKDSEFFVPKNVNQYRHIIECYYSRESDLEWMLKLRRHKKIKNIQKEPTTNPPNFYNEDYEKYLLCMFKGFGHEESNEVFHYDEEREKEMKEAYTREYLNKDLKVSIVDKEGNYVAHCGMWYDSNSEIALIEPVCVVPECRRLGLGREVVYEGLRKVKLLGAKRAVVGSSQQFYYSLGMVPHKTGTLWKPVE